MKGDHARAAEHYGRAIAARPGDQTLYRDLAEILVGSDRRPEAIELLARMPVEGERRAEISIMLAQAYVDKQRYDDAIELLESTPHFVNWEGQDLPLVLFRTAHLARGQQRFEKGEHAEALAHFEAALTYPGNIGVGRSSRPQEAKAEYWRGKALAALGRTDEARDAWQRGADGPRGSDEQNEHRDLCRKALASPPESP
jgi:tetratricopeptide (TPR) repeat protein